MSASMEEWLRGIIEDADFSRYDEWKNKQIEKIAKRAKKFAERTIYVPIEYIVPFEKSAMEEGWQKTKEAREKMEKIARHTKGMQK